MSVPEKKEFTVRDYIYSPTTVKQLERVLPSFLNAERFLRVVYTALLRNPKLLECSKESILSCMIQSAQLGLEPIMGKAALIPYGKECQFQPEYKGLIDLARRTGEIKITAHVVYENDEFDVEYGTEDKIFHKPCLTGKRGNMIGAYTVWTYPSGMQTYLFMPEEEILDVRNKYSKGWEGEDSMWQKRPGEAYKKTVLKNHSKLQPCSIEVATAVQLDNLAEVGQTQLGVFAGFQLPETTGPETPIDLSRFNSEIAINSGDTAQLAHFVKMTAAANGITIDQLKAEAIKDAEGFLKSFDAWAEKQGGDPAGKTKPDLFTWIKKARPGTSDKNKAAFVKTIGDNLEEIESWKWKQPEQYGYVKEKYEKTIGELWPFPEKPQEDTQELPSEQNSGSGDTKADNSGPGDRVGFYGQAVEAKKIFAEAGKVRLYMGVLSDFNCETMNDIPPEKEKEFIKALHSAIDQMNAEE